ncbi:hypothetical protein E3N88_38965 [Mikania micrantha]|uniref:Uncharacterized protein n=1 Tax=Mikania micrantha TaxID=192012 RepID=A0A5N6LVG9_9ASTR|nr:hypothetical protein E3N88_38965 [Mikania micrantha]
MWVGGINWCCASLILADRVVVGDESWSQRKVMWFKVQSVGIDVDLDSNFDREVFCSFDKGGGVDGAILRSGGGGGNDELG